MPLWSWPVPTCCWEVRSCRKLFQLSVMLKCWCASWRSALRHHYRHYAWLRKTKVSECQSTLCDGTYGGTWWHTVYCGKVLCTFNKNSLFFICYTNLKQNQKIFFLFVCWTICQPIWGRLQTKTNAQMIWITSYASLSFFQSFSFETLSPCWHSMGLYKGYSQVKTRDGVSVDLWF